jgi:23S rRNA (guanine745-N1)-methyltransferase
MILQCRVDVVIPPLACTVRHCGLLLERHGRAYRCARHHSYDVARSGYVNLLQPTDRRSLSAGDNPDAIAARARLLARGVGHGPILAAAAKISPKLAEDSVVVDLGSGSGELLARVQAQAQHRCIPIGIDLSIAAAEHAAKSHPDVTWVVANADRRLPLLDSTVDVVTSIHGRRNPTECARVLTRGGELVVAVPAPDDLIELRAHVQGRAVERERGQTVVAEHAPLFSLIELFEIREQRRLSADALRDVLRGTYRAERRSLATRLQGLEELHVTLASLIFVFARA